MRTIKNYLIEEETWEEQSQAGRYNPAQVLLFRDRHGKHRVTINAGTSDVVDVFREQDVTYVLSTNRRMYYVGLEAFIGKEKIGDVFLQNEYEMDDILGDEGLSLSSMEIVKKLINYMPFN